MVAQCHDIRIGWMSHHIEGVEPLEAVLEAGFPIHAIITLEQDLLAKKSGAFDFEDIARRHDIPLVRIRNVNKPDSLAHLESLALDYLFVIGWSQILREPALALVKQGCFGAHASLLPANRGSAPINWAVIKGEAETGNTLMRLSAAVDAGDIIAQRRIEITPFDNVGTLYHRVAETNRDMILELIADLCAERPLAPRQQELDGSPLLPRRKPRDGVVDWNQPARAIYDFIRALTRPYPGAFSSFGGNRYQIWRSAVLPAEGVLAEPGTVLGPVFSDQEEACGLMLACGTGAIVVLEVENEQGDVLQGACLATAGFAGVWSNEEVRRD